MEKPELRDLSGSITLPFFEAMFQQIPVSIIDELHRTLEDLYGRDLKSEATMILYALISLSGIQCLPMVLEMQGNPSLMKDFAGEVLTDWREILNEYL